MKFIYNVQDMFYAGSVARIVMPIFTFVPLDFMGWNPSNLIWTSLKSTLLYLPWMISSRYIPFTDLDIRLLPYIFKVSNQIDVTYIIPSMLVLLKLHLPSKTKWQMLSYSIIDDWTMDFFWYDWVHIHVYFPMMSPLLSSVSSRLVHQLYGRQL